MAPGFSACYNTYFLPCNPRKVIPIIMFCFGSFSFSLLTSLSNFITRAVVAKMSFLPMVCLDCRLTLLPDVYTAVCGVPPALLSQWACMQKVVLSGFRRNFRRDSRLLRSWCLLGLLLPPGMWIYHSKLNCLTTLPPSVSLRYLSETY